MKQTVTCMMGILISLAFVSCSSNDAPDKPLSAREQYNLLLGTISDADGNIVFAPCNESGTVRGIEMYDEKESKAFCEVLLHDSWNGEKTTRIISDEYGWITASKSDESGVFHTVSFNLKDIEPFTLKLASAEYFNDDNFTISLPGAHASTYWRCKSCGYLSFYSSPKPHPCPACHKDQWEPYTTGDGFLW